MCFGRIWESLCSWFILITACGAPSPRRTHASSRKLARTRKFEFVLGSEDVAAIADQNGWNLEDAGRRLRYEFFQRLVEEGRATRIAVAHTADDQAETVLAHIMRGTGPAGLGGYSSGDWPGSAAASWSSAAKNFALICERLAKHGARTRRTRTCRARARGFGSNCCRCCNVISLRKSWTGCPILRGSPGRKRHSGARLWRIASGLWCGPRMEFFRLRPAICSRLSVHRSPRRQVLCHPAQICRISSGP